MTKGPYLKLSNCFGKAHEVHKCHVVPNREILSTFNVKRCNGSSRFFSTRQRDRV